MYNDAGIINGYYGVNYKDKNGNKKFKRYGKAVTLNEIRCNLENGDITWRISFEYLGKLKTFDMPRNSIAEKKLASYLQGKGADITPKTFNCFVDSMRLQEANITTAKSTYNKLGWIKIPYNGKLEYAYRCSKLVGNIKGEYDGNLELKPQGKLEDWLTMVKTEVLGRPQLETILLAALSAPIVDIHGMSTTTDNPIYHINFSSGKGKSTVCYLATSVSGAPFDGVRTEYNQYGNIREKSSIYGSWGATPKATVSTHAGNRGVVAVLNELGKFGGLDMTQVVFNLSEGSDIKRLNTQLQTLVTEGFNTVFISCGEMSLIGKCKSKLEGIRNRVMEISVPMTESAEHARSIKDSCIKNNGYAATMIAKYIIDNGGFEMIQDMYAEVLGELTSTAPQGIHDRYIEKFPTFLVMAARLARVVLGLDFDIHSVVDFCYDCVKESKEDDGDICKSFDEIVEDFNINIDNFIDVSRPSHTPKVVWGKVTHPKRVEKDRQLTCEYYVYPNLLKAMLGEKGYPNVNTELKIWREKGVLDCDEHHLTKKVNFKFGDRATTRMYVLQLWEPVKPKKTNKSQFSNLIADDETAIIEKEDIENGNADCI